MRHANEYVCMQRDGSVCACTCACARVHMCMYAPVPHCLPCRGDGPHPTTHTPPLPLLAASMPRQRTAEEEPDAEQWLMLHPSKRTVEE